MVMGDVRVNHRALTRFVTAVFSATGMGTSDAGTVAEVLVWANERGIDSHGVMRIPSYLTEIKNGKFTPTPNPRPRRFPPERFMMGCSGGAGPFSRTHPAGLAIKWTHDS